MPTNQTNKMKIEIKYNDGTKRIIGSATDITSCLDKDLGKGWVDAGGLIWTSEAADEHPEDHGVYAFAEILVDGIRTDLSAVPA